MFYTRFYTPGDAPRPYPLPTMVALTEHFLALEVLLLDQCNGRTGDFLVQGLPPCPNLKTLVSLDHPSEWHCSCCPLGAKLFIDRDPSTDTFKPWECETSLQVLKVKITKIPRPDLEEG